MATQNLRKLCLLIAQCCVFSSATIIRVENIISRKVDAVPASVSLEQLEAGFGPTVIEVGQWRNQEFCLGLIFGVMSCGIIITLMLGCQVIQFVPANSRSSCEGTSEEVPAVPGRDEEAEAAEVDSLTKFWPRVGWLAAMLMLQSVSGIILSKFRHLVRTDPDLIFFLTMLIGLGGNAGGQSVVLTCRKLLRHERITIRDQLITGILMGLVLAPLAFLRGLISKTEIRTCVTLAAATLLIAAVATSIGTALPKMLQMIKADPGEAAAMIQVIMDIVGVMCTCCLGALILQS
mmetsp:Transcript_3798/g.4718  ORF Transcript_3798/g.4718 Transcript_3798/m.4718 type:complete len:291 (+) Transcript_3798:127-999(+)